MGDALESCMRLLEFFPREEVDDYAVKQLRQAMADHMQTKRPWLADVAFEIDGKRCSSLLEALADKDWEGRLMLRFFSPSLDQNWDYNRPTRLIRIIKGGIGVMESFDYNPYTLQKWDVEAGVQRDEIRLRAHFTKFFVPESIKSHTRRSQSGEELVYASGLLTPEEMWRKVRTGSAIPLQVRFCAYTHTTRYAYEIDLPRGKLVRDFRGGVLQVTGKHIRTAQECYAFDKLLASISLPENVRKAFVTVFERTDTTVFDIAHALGMLDASARNTLYALVSRKFVKVSGGQPRETYEANIDEITRAAAGA
jgi:hypothetical protein